MKRKKFACVFYFVVFLQFFSFFKTCLYIHKKRERQRKKEIAKKYYYIDRCLNIYIFIHPNIINILYKCVCVFIYIHIQIKSY